MATSVNMAAVVGVLVSFIAIFSTVSSSSEMTLRHQSFHRQTTGSSPLLQDYCQWEAFNASCPSGHVIVMESAQFGRMRLGRCVDTDVYIGCAADVLPLIDSRCSGRPSCVVKLPDSSLHQQQACPKDLVAYLEASYSCVDVGPVDPDACNGPRSAAGTKSKLPTHRHVQDTSGQTSSEPTAGRAGLSSLMGRSDGFLASYYAQTMGQGRPGCPWTIVVDQGQRVQLSLIDFSSATRYRIDTSFKSASSGSVRYPEVSFDGSSSAGDLSPVPADYCYVYATVAEEDRPAVRRFTICAEESRSEQIVYTSVSSAVTLEVTEAVIADMSINFIIKYTAVGCADLNPPLHAHVERNGERVTVTCNMTSQSWHLICKGTTWIGPQTHDCQEGSPVGEKVTDDPPFPTYGLVIAVVIGVVVGSVCGFLLLALVLSCRRRGAYNRPRRHMSMAGGEIPLTVAPSTDSNEHVCKYHGLATTSAGEYGYTHVWQLQHQPRQQGMMTAPDISVTSSLPDSAYHTTTTSTIGESGFDVSTLSGEDRSVGGVVPASRTRRDHLYECPIINERLLNGYPLPVSSANSSNHVCRHHQSHYQLERSHHPMCPHGRHTVERQHFTASDQIELLQPSAVTSATGTLPLQPVSTFSSFQAPVVASVEPPASPGPTAVINDVISHSRRRIDSLDGQLSVPPPSMPLSTQRASSTVGCRVIDEPDLTTATHRLKAENHYL